MKNVVTGLLIVFFVSVYILSATSVHLVPRENSGDITNELCGVSVGNGYEISRIHQLKAHDLKLIFVHTHGENILSNIDTDFSFDLFSVNENSLPDGNYLSSLFISRENQKPRKLYEKPADRPS